MATATVYQPPEHVVKGAHVDSLEKYKDMYAQSLKDPEASGSSGPAAGGAPGRDIPTQRFLNATCAPRPVLQGFWGAFMDQFHWNKKWESGENFHK